MQNNELERHLEAGQRWGFSKRTDDVRYLGWVLLNKRRPRTVPAFDPTDKPEQYAQFISESDEIHHQPYHVMVIELRRDVHEKGAYETDEDYRLRENHYFPTLDQAIAFLDSIGFSLGEIRPAAEIDAP